MNVKWMCGIVFFALLVSTALPISVMFAGNEECVDCFNQCDFDYSLCMGECYEEPPGEMYECRQACRQEYIQCNQYCRWEVCTRA